MNIEENYKKFRWFFTSSEKLVIGGKNAEQNDFLLKEIKKTGKDFVIMHTAMPGSPFSIIFSEIKNVKEEDIEECAIFTASFSRAWKLGKEKAEIHIFNLSQLQKTTSMKKGTWAVIGKITKKEAPLSLVLTIQKKTLRAVPFSTLKGKSPLLTLCPGKIDKTHLIPKLQIELDEKFSQDEILSALPAGGITICTQKQNSK